MAARDLPPITSDPVIEWYKQFVDMDELRANLQLTPTQRMEKLMRKLAEEEERARLELAQPDLTSASSG